MRFFARDVPIALLVGAVAGGLARVVFEVLIPPWDTLANTSALWGLVPFGVSVVLRQSDRRARYGHTSHGPAWSGRGRGLPGYTRRRAALRPEVPKSPGWTTLLRRAGALGGASLVAMVIVWVVTAPVPPTARLLALWTVVAVLAGAVCGLAGALAANGLAPVRWLACSVISGIILGEAAYGILLIGGPQWWLEAAIGVVLGIVLGRDRRDRVVNLAGSVVVAALLFLVFVAYDAIAVG